MMARGMKARDTEQVSALLERIVQAQGHIEWALCEEIRGHRDASGYIRVLAVLTSDDYAHGFVTGATAAIREHT